MSDHNSDGKPEGAPASTMVAVPRLEMKPDERFPRTHPVAERLSFGSLAMPTEPPGGPGTGTMVGIGRVPMNAPAPPSVPSNTDAGATMVGIGRVPANYATPPPVPSNADAGATMVGIGRVPANHAASTPAPAHGDAGATMVGIGRVPANHAASASTPVGTDAGATMVGIGRVAMASHSPAPSPARLSGPPPAYEITAHLGGGELGQVFHARRRKDGHPVALRIIRPEIAAVPGANEALRQVATLAAHAVHTHLGRIYEFDETASSTLVLEYVPGKKLSVLMQERGAAPAAAVIDLGIRLCSALAAAHGAGLAHGRVHAGNVVIESKSGRWVLLDKGHGYCVQDLEPSHDLYALGALLYQMATGHDPFETGSVRDPRVHVPKLPNALSALLMRTLAPDPALWFGSAIELAQTLVRAKTLA